jgi:hypothetical protein
VLRDSAFEHRFVGPVEACVEYDVTFAGDDEKFRSCFSCSSLHGFQPVVGGERRDSRRQRCGQ